MPLLLIPSPQISEIKRLPAYYLRDVNIGQNRSWFYSILRCHIFKKNTTGITYHV